MARAGLVVLLALWAVSPWAGCDRAPVTPPASPPPERAPAASPSVGDGVQFRIPTRRFG